MNQLRATSWIDPLRDQVQRPTHVPTAPIWFVLGGVSAAAVTAVAIAARALRVAGGRPRD